MSLKAKEFLAKHRMGYDTIVLENEIDEYIDEMKKGLCGEPSSLLMLPSYLALQNDVQREKPVLCVDAGGTNLRIAVAKFLKMCIRDRLLLPDGRYSRR